jgi:hypothetical protein
VRDGRMIRRNSWTTSITWALVCQMIATSSAATIQAQTAEIGPAPSPAAPALNVALWPPSPRPRTAPLFMVPNVAFPDAEHHAPAEGKLFGPALNKLIAREATTMAQASPTGRLSSGGSTINTVPLFLFGTFGVGLGIFLLGPGSSPPASTDSSGCNTTGVTRYRVDCNTLKVWGGALVGAGALLLVLGVISKKAVQAGPRVIGQNANGRVTTQVKNQTPDSIEITFDGPVTRTITVTAGDIQTVDLDPGQYRVTAQGIGSNIEPYRGLQTYSPGIAYAETYFKRQ